MIEVAQTFGTALDKDEFEVARKLIAPNCTYVIGDETLNGPEAICNSYEQNMLEGKRKLDELIWGQSEVEEIATGEYFVHFTDYLKHKGKSHVHRCKQRLKVNLQGLITSIEHIDNTVEQKELDAFYRSVGLS